MAEIVIDREELINRGVYQHYKGGKYIILGFGIHEKTLKTCVIYASIDKPSDPWIRTVADFKATVNTPTGDVKRFTQITN